MNEEKEGRIIFDLEQARIIEARRRRALLSDLANSEYDYARLREWSRRILVPCKPLWTWWQEYCHKGFEGLLPKGWEALDEPTQEKVRQRYCPLMPLADGITVTKEQVKALAQRNSWSERTALRWVQRYRVGGLWGLAPDYDPEQRSAPAKFPSPIRAPHTLDAAAFDEIEHRLFLVGEELLRQRTLSRKDVEAQAKKVGKSERTIWNYHALYRDYGPLGLAPRERSDREELHGISEFMIEVVRGLRFSQNRKLSLRAVHQEACQRARALGEPEPSLWQVRMICTHVPGAERALAAGREDIFRNKYAITWDMKDARLREPLIIYEIDHNLVDVLVKDLRPPPYCSASGTIRPWLTLCLDRRCRLVMSAMFSYDRPDRHTVAAVIREAVLVTEEKPYGGIPDQLVVDNGKELLAEHIKAFTQELKILLHPCTPHYPQQKGTEERFFGTLTTRLWAKQLGYVDSNTAERNPHAHAKLTLAELEANFRAFITQYHHEHHSRLPEEHTPLTYWMCSSCPEHADVRTLDALLKEQEERKVNKAGISYRNRLYWDSAFADVVGTKVIIRAAPTYVAPEEIEVYSGNQWLCTAFAVNSKEGLEVTAEEVVSAKRQQRQNIRGRIQRSREAVKTADREIESLQAKKQPEKTESTMPTIVDQESQPLKNTEDHAETPAQQSAVPASAPKVNKPVEKALPKSYFERMIEREKQTDR